jgi:malate dehydrogenase (oxaloacetate-decarboxylating)
LALSEQLVAELRRRALALHRDHHGKIEVVSKVPLRDADDLSLAYTPGVAQPCLEIARDPALAYEYTAKANLVAVVTDGTAVLGLGDIGPAAAMPVMEGKCVLFKTFAGVDAVPICLATKNVDRIVEIVAAISPTFGGINLEDISAPRCFEIEARLRRETRIPVFHDDQHGTAIVTAAALINALKIVGKAGAAVKVVINGAGAAGMAVTRLLLQLGVVRIVLCDRAGAIHADRRENMNPYKVEIAATTNPDRERGDLATVIRGADVFIGLSVGGALTPAMVRSMAPAAVVMAMANPEPEIHPAEAAAAGARVICTGRMDYPNQINNVQAFPGVFRGALDVRAREINDVMKMAAARAIAALTPEAELSPQRLMPDTADRRVAPAVAAAVARAAVESGVAALTPDLAGEAERTQALVAAAARQAAASNAHLS